MKSSKLIILTTAVVLIALFFLMDLHHHFSLTGLKSNLHDLQIHQQAHPLAAISIYMIIYIAMTTLSLPGATIMTLAGGAVFGLFKGVIIVSFASTIGATLAFLVARFLFRESIQTRFGDKLTQINRGIDKEGGFYLFSLRLVPLFPFFVINVLMGLTRLPTVTYALVSQVGMFPATIVYVNAGKHLSQLNSLEGILSPGLIFAFAVLGIFPIAAKKALNFIRSRKVMAHFKKPKQFDYNLVVIGAGSAGLVASYIAAAVKAKVALIERDKMGGDCLNTGCVPSKALIKSANVLSLVKRAEEFGFEMGHIEFDFAKVMKRVHEVIGKVAPHDSVERYTNLGVDCISGEAIIRSPYEVEIRNQTDSCRTSDHSIETVSGNGMEKEFTSTASEKKKVNENLERTILTTRNIIIATGAKPTIPIIPGLDTISYYTSDTIWSIPHLPQTLLVLGGGPIGCELAQAFSHLGSRVTIVQRGDRLMKKEDPEVSDLIKKKFQDQGISVVTGHAAKKIVNHELICTRTNGEKETIIPFDTLLLALGRTPNVTGLGLEALEISISDTGTIENGAFLETAIPTIFCAGDVAGPYQFTHTAAHQSWFASINALFGSVKKFRIDYRTIPWATFTHPEVARVGLNESEAKEKKIPYEVTRYDIDDLDRAIADSEAHGFVKVLTVPGKDKILGVTIVGNHAGDIISEFILAMKHGLGLNKILGTIHIYPTMAEANKYAAGQWKKAHVPEKMLQWAEKFHTWMRG